MVLKMVKGKEIGVATDANSTIKRIFIGGLGPTVTASDMEKTFSPLGKTSNIEFVRSDVQNFAFMDFEPNSDKSLAKLFAVYNGCAWKGGKLRLERAKEHYLARLKREWAEDANLNVPDDPNVEKSSDYPNKSESLLHKPESLNRENAKLQIYFPKLQKIKSVPFKGTGKHKYSFQRVEVPPLPIHFCDCEEHCRPAETINETYMSALNSAAYKKERSIMTSVMNKFLEKEGNKVHEPGMVSFLTEEIDVDTHGDGHGIQLNQTDKTQEEDADNLVTNIGMGQSDDILLQLLGKPTNLMDQVHESGTGKPQPSTDGHLQNKMRSRKRQRTTSTVTSDDALNQAASSIAVATEDEFDSVLPTSKIVKVDKQQEILTKGSSIETQSECGADTVVLAKPNTWIQKFSWRDLVGQSGDSTFSISNILPASESLKANDSTTKMTSMPKKKKGRSDGESSANVTVEGNALLAKIASTSLIKESENANGETTLGNDNVGENQSNHQGEQKRRVPKINIGEVCTFMRSANSEKEWSRTRAVLSGYLKKKGDGSRAPHEAKAKPRRR